MKCLSIFVRHIKHTHFLAASPRYCLSSFATCNTAQVSILKRWWSSMHRAGESHHDPTGSDLTFEEELIIEREKKDVKIRQDFQDLDFWERFSKRFFRNFHSKHGINSGFVGMPAQGRSILVCRQARNYRVPTVLWRCNKSYKRTVATERLRSPASQVSGPGGKLHGDVKVVYGCFRK